MYAGIHRDMCTCAHVHSSGAHSRQCEVKPHVHACACTCTYASTRTRLNQVQVGQQLSQATWTDPCNSLFLHAFFKSCTHSATPAHALHILHTLHILRTHSSNPCAVFVSQRTFSRKRAYMWNRCSFLGYLQQSNNIAHK